MSDDVKYNGRCLCGDVKVEIVAEPLWSSHCHCPSCQKATSAAFATYVGFDRTAVRFTAEEPKMYRSSPGVKRRFCGKCGSPVSFEGEEWPGEIHFHALFLEQAPVFEPEANIYVRSRMPWVELSQHLPKHDQFPDE
ncbi:GFA family protein [Kordiimonas sp.]|uniref:GFA family protein n=1 Tax=Kordiimonas sp. TaxID=1970157 RepID=UPI003A8D5363